jgi:methionine-rich copper-binding protein CopC
VNKNLTIAGRWYIVQPTTIIDADNQGRVFNITNGVNVTLKYLTIRDGNATDGSTASGGGILNNGTLTVYKCHIKYNTGYGGGGIYNRDDASLTVMSSTIILNSVPTGYGAGISNSGDLTVNDSIINSNTAYAGGGGIFNQGDATVIDSEISSNNALLYGGGGIYNWLGSFTITGSSINSNTANHYINGKGGGIYNINADLNVTGCNFDLNQSPKGNSIYNNDTSAKSQVIHFSRIFGGGHDIYSDSGSVDARYNWWGDFTTNPSTKVYGTVDTSSWLVLNVTANPSIIGKDSTSNITADLTHDFNGVYHDPANGHLPNGLSIIFTTSLGSITSPKSTVNGLAKTTLNGGSVGGVADVSASLDIETVNTSVTVDTPPTVTAIDPLNNKVNVDADKVITVVFNEPIQEGTMWIDLKNSTGTIISTTQSISDNTLTITPTSNLAESKYTLLIHTGAIIDLTGNPVAAKSSKFIVGTSPTVTTIDPANNAVNIARNKVITITFNEPIKAGSMWIDLKDSSGTLISTTKSVSGNVLTITPSTLLTNGTKYTLSLHTGAITDLAGNPVAIYSSKFTTSTDGTAPTVTNIDPANNTVNVPTNKVITVTFSENIKNGTGWVELKNSSGTLIATTTGISGNKLTITPTSPLGKGVKYSVIIHTGAITDTAGNPVAAYTSKFTTTTI